MKVDLMDVVICFSVRKGMLRRRVWAMSDLSSQIIHMFHCSNEELVFEASAFLSSNRLRCANPMPKYLKLVIAFVQI